MNLYEQKKKIGRQKCLPEQHYIYKLLKSLHSNRCEVSECKLVNEMSANQIAVHLHSLTTLMGTEGPELVTLVYFGREQVFERDDYDIHVLCALTSYFFIISLICSP